MFCFAFSRSHSRSACSPRAPSLFELPSQGNSPDPVMVALKCLFFPHLAYFFIYRFAYKKQQHLSTLLLIKGFASFPPKSDYSAYYFTSSASLNGSSSGGLVKFSARSSEITVSPNSCSKRSRAT